MSVGRVYLSVKCKTEANPEVGLWLVQIACPDDVVG